MRSWAVAVTQRVNTEKFFSLFPISPKSQPVILGDGEGFVQTENLFMQGEQYSLYAGIHVPRESLLSGNKATIAIRQCVVNGVPADLTLLEESKFTVTSTNADNVSSSMVKQDLKVRFKS